MMKKSKSLQRLLGVAKPEFRTLSWGLFFLVISSGSALVYPQVIRWMVDNVLQAKRLDWLWWSVGVLFVVFILQGITSSFRYYLFTLSGERIVLKLRQRLFSNLMSQEVSFFDFHRTGELMSRLASDATTLQNTVSVNISQGLRNLGQVIGGLGFMFYTSWRLTAIMFLLIPPVALFAAIFGKKIRAHSKNLQEAVANSSIVAEETLSGIKTVKSFVRESFEVSRYTTSLDQALLFVKARISAITVFMIVAMSVGFTAVCVVLAYGGYQVIQGALSVGDLTQFLLYLMLVAIGVGSLGSLWGDFAAGLGASERIFEILEKPSMERTSGIRPQTVSGKIEFSNVSFSYPTRKDIAVVKNLSFTINPGETVAFVGSSGAGKSTVASLIPGYYPIDAGTIKIDGVDMAALDVSWLRAQIGIVSQEPILISSTVEENIKYGRENATSEEIKTAARSANALEFIQRFPDGMQTKVGEKGLQLSGGQKQRVAIARALLKDPKILILDEATSSLDTESEALVQDALMRLMQGRTSLVIAHRLSTIVDADRIFVLDNGEVVQHGTHDELSRNRDGIYYKLLQKQFSGDSE
ncbi:MAG: ATP-binding cassette domain-containing protein [Bdellovibrionaceae bacterium]|nr:ATP-binding cassette domain-containing protein [Pseudobdellovibrionaceae bacterium]